MSSRIPSLERESRHRHCGSTAKSYGCALAANRAWRELSIMKNFILLSFVATALVGIAQPTWAGHGGGGGGFGGGGFGGGGHFGGGGFGGGHFAGGGFGGGGFRGGHIGGFGGARFGGPIGGGLHTAPGFYGRGAYYTGRNIGGFSRPSYAYRGGPRMPTGPRGSTAAVGRRANPLAGRVATANRQTIRPGSTVGGNRGSNPRTSTPANRQSFLKNHAFARHDGNWHRDWDRHHAHFDHNRVFVFADGFWWGLYPWDFYGSYPFDDDAYPYDYGSGYPYDYYGSSYPYDSSYDYPYNSYDDSSYDYSGQQSNPTVREVQSQLAKLGYYHGAIDGILGDETEAAVSRYQQDHDLSVTGTVTSATLQSLGD